MRHKTLPSRLREGLGVGSRPITNGTVKGGREPTPDPSRKREGRKKA